MAIKIAMIGAGSIGFTRRLMQDILTVPELADTEFAFMDISESNLDMVTQLARRDLQASGAAGRTQRDHSTAAQPLPRAITSSAPFARAGWKPSSMISISP